jgi:MFS family permease
MVIFIGIGEAMLVVSASTMIMDLLPEGRSGEFLGLNSVMQAIPAALGALGGGIITGLLGQYRAYLLLYTAGMILSALFVMKIQIGQTMSVKKGT